MALLLCECGCGRETASGAQYLKGHTSQSRGSAYYRLRDLGHDTPCWYWLRAVDKDGYPKASRGRMHRVYFEDAIRPLRKGEVIDHLCRVHRCVNPAHMEAVTVAENRRRGMHVKLSPRDIPLIRTLLFHGISEERTGRAFGVSREAVRQIKKGQSWNDC